MHKSAPSYLALAFAAVALLAWTLQGGKSEAAPVDVRYSQPGRLVSINGHRINLYCFGKGAPTVVFDSGLGNWALSWALVQPHVAKVTRTCSYDRAGYGFSDPGPLPRTSSQIVTELHAVLRKTGERPPYILVGHSFGGMNVRLFADRYLSDVTGIVLVDSSHEDQLSHLAPGLQREERLNRTRDEQKLVRCESFAQRGFVNVSRSQKNICIARWMPRTAALSESLKRSIEREALKPSTYVSAISEEENFSTASADEIRNARRSYGSIPLRIVTAGDHYGDLRKASPEELRESREFEHTWNTLQRSWLALSSNARQTYLPRSGHTIQLEEPEAVIDAIREEVTIYRFNRTQHK